MSEHNESCECHMCRPGAGYVQTAPAGWVATPENAPSEPAISDQAWAALCGGAYDRHAGREEHEALLQAEGNVLRTRKEWDELGDDIARLEGLREDDKAELAALREKVAAGVTNAEVDHWCFQRSIRLVTEGLWNDMVAQVQQAQRDKAELERLRKGLKNAAATQAMPSGTSGNNLGNGVAVARALAIQPNLLDPHLGHGDAGSER